MTVKELIEALSEYDEEAEVRLASQPSWPFEYGIRGVVSTEEIDPAENEDDFGDEKDEELIVYVVEGEQLKYGSSEIFKALNRTAARRSVSELS